MNRKNILIPAAVFLAFAALYVSISLINTSDLLFRPVWDIGHYQSIAERGYEVYPCDPEVHYPLGEICGNVGWFPGWPLAIKFLSLGQVGFALRFFPYLFALLGFILFYHILYRLADARAAVIGLIALASAPSAFYFLTGFPYSFMLFLFTAYLYYLYTPRARGRLILIPVIALVLSLTYPSAFLTAVIPLVMVISQYRSRAARPKIGGVLRDLAFYMIPFALGPLLLSAYYYVTFDDFLLIVHFQEKYHRQWGFPLSVLWSSLLQFPALYVENGAVLFYGLIFFVFARYRLRPELIAYFALLFLFSPTTGSITSVYRHYLILFPAAMIIGSSQRPLWVKIAFIVIGLTMALVRYFPIFMDGRLI